MLVEIRPFRRKLLFGKLLKCIIYEEKNHSICCPVKIGRQNPQYYEVTEGLSSGEKVIISGYELFGDNEKLILK